GPRVGRKEPQAAGGALGERGHQGVSRGRDPVVAPAVVLVWAAVLLFVLYPMSRLLVLTFWNGGPTLEAVRGLLGDWTHRAALVNIDATLEDSAFSLGARRWRVFATVTLPLATPGVANAFLLVSAASLADFATPLILAGTKFPVLPTQAFLQITGLYDMRGGAALCFLLLVPTLAIFAGQRRWLERRGGSFVTVTGKASAATRVKSL